MAKILIIDDEELIRKMLRKVLEKNGYEVMEASNYDIVNPIVHVESSGKDYP
jgi:DNA-binding response OmpR family regulator